MVTKFYHKKISRNDSILVLERLYMLISAGISLPNALAIIIDTSGGCIRLSISSILKSIESGKPLHYSLQTELRLSNEDTSIIRYAEQVGRLPEAILKTVNLMEGTRDMVSKTLSALVYPAVVGFCSVAIVVVMMTVIVPQMEPILLTMNTSMPLMTRTTFYVGHLFREYWLVLILVSMLLVVLFFVAMNLNGKVRGKVITGLTYIPFIGQFLVKYQVIVFLRTIGMLIESGIPVASAFTDSVSILHESRFGRRMRAGSTKIISGVSLSSILTTKEMPPYVISLVSAGEKSGVLGASIIKAVSILEKDMSRDLKRISSLLEPVIMALMGIVVGGIAISIMMPIYEISKSIKMA